MLTSIQHTDINMCQFSAVAVVLGGVVVAVVLLLLLFLF
jgi:hypothetical protein